MIDIVSCAVREFIIKYDIEFICKYMIYFILAPATLIPFWWNKISYVKFKIIMFLPEILFGFLFGTFYSIWKWEELAKN